jgi:hypothetical protein
MIPDHRLAEILDERDQLARIIGRSIVTAKRNARGSK